MLLEELRQVPPDFIHVLDVAKKKFPFPSQTIYRLAISTVL
jgi:hypothetical protein